MVAQPPAVDDTVTPPTADEAYWLGDYGDVGVDAEGTACILGHSILTGRAVFTDLVDLEQQRSRLEVGDEIIVTTEHGEVVYHVQCTEFHDRGDLASIEHLWTPNPGRLVLVTCLFDSECQSIDQNVVVYVQLAPESAGEPDRDR